jgi:hypothetical protein
MAPMPPVNKNRRRVFAATLAIGFLCRSQPVPAAELGLVFYTPEQRRALEKQLAEAGERSSEVGQNGERSAPVGPRVVHFNGVVRRSGGPGAAWLDGRRLGPDSVPANVRARLIGERLELTSPDSRRVLRPGDRETLVAVPPSSETRLP